MPPDLYRRCPLFSLLTPRQWDVLVPAGQEATFRTGETIFQEGPNLKNWLRLQGLVCHLRGQSFLGFMSGTTSLAFLDCLQPAVFPAQHTIQAEGLADDRWYFLESGRVRLDPDGAEGQPQELGP